MNIPRTGSEVLASLVRVVGCFGFIPRGSLAFTSVTRKTSWGCPWMYVVTGLRSHLRERKFLHLEIQS